MTCTGGDGMCSWPSASVVGCSEDLIGTQQVEGRKIETEKVEVGDRICLFE
jgi:hypothetical protein